MLSYVPPTWTYECDEDLVHFLYDHLGKEDQKMGRGGQKGNVQ